MNGSESKLGVKRFFVFDLLLVLSLLFIAGILALVFYLNSGEGELASVIVDGELVAAYPLSCDRVEPIITKYGENRLVIRERKAFIEWSDCPTGSCVKHRAVSLVGEALICEPHTSSSQTAFADFASSTTLPPI